MNPIFLEAARSSPGFTYGTKQRYSDVSGKGTTRAYFLTKGAKWLDIVDLEVTQEGDSVRVIGKSVSAALLPASLPIIGPLLSMVLAFLPFLDHGQNLRHLNVFGSALKLRFDVKEDVQIKGAFGHPRAMRLD